MISRFFRHIKEGFVGFFRHPVNSLSAVVASVLSLFIIAFFIVLAFNLANLTKNVEDSLSLSALVKYNLSDDKIKTIETNIKNITGVTSVEYRSSEDEFNFYVEQNNDLKEFYETYRDDNPFHSTFLVYVEDGELLGDIKTKISNIEGIDSVHDGGDNTYKLISILHDVRLFGLILICLTAFLGIYQISNTIKLSIEGRSVELSIMRIVGATKGFIRAPFLIEGIIIGFFGAFITDFIVVLGYLYLYSSTDGVLLGVFDLLNPNPYIIYISLTILVIGIITGFIGSFFSVSRALRKVR